MEDMSGNFRIIATISKGIAAFYALMSLSFISHVLVAYKVLKYVLRKCRAYQPGLTATGNMGKKFSSHSYVYILALTTVDAIVVGHLPLIALDILLQRWPFGPTMCKFYWAAECLNKQLSTLIMAAFSFDRYLAVCRPNERKLRSVKMATVVVSLCVILASLLILPVVSNAELRDMAGDDVGRSPNFSENSNNKSILKCSLNWSSENEFIYTCVLFVISYCFPLVLMIFFYGKIVLVIKRHGKRAAIIKDHNNRRRSKTRTVTKRTFALISFYFLCSTPYWIMTIWSMLSSKFSMIPQGESSRPLDNSSTTLMTSLLNESDLSGENVTSPSNDPDNDGPFDPTSIIVFYVVHSLVYVNSALNPIFYGFYNSQLKPSNLTKKNSLLVRTLVRSRFFEILRENCCLESARNGHHFEMADKNLVKREDWHPRNVVNENFVETNDMSL